MPLIGGILILFFAACGGENAYDGEEGLISAKAQTTTDAFTSIQENILIPDAEKLQQSLQTLKTSVSTFETNTTLNQLALIQENFKTSAFSWKNVQTAFIAADFDKELIDLVILIDHFHIGNESVATLLDNILAKEADLAGLLYKNSTKGFTALEYLLFGEAETNEALLVEMQKSNKRRIQAIGLVIDNLIKRTTPILTFYQNDTTFKADVQEASDSLMNILIDSSYKLKEWRVGDAAGLTVKYKNQSNQKRLEYYRSRASLEGIKAILETHAKLMKPQSFSNFSDFANANSASKELQEVIGYINAAQTLVDSFDKTLEESVSDEKIHELYLALVNLHNGYYLSLINALNITSKIIEADGD